MSSEASFARDRPLFNTRLVVPRAGYSATGGALARVVVDRMLRGVPVRLRYPDAHIVGAGGADSPILDLLCPAEVFRRLERHPKIGLGEAYMAGEWRAGQDTDLADLLKPFAAKLTRLVPARLRRLRWMVERGLPAATRNTLAGSRANIAAHYDLADELFEAFLDPTLTYSSALFDRELPFEVQDLAEAQRRKIDAILDSARVGRGSRVLEIGSGWGELAIRAANRGAVVITITLSEEQLRLARRRVAAAGLGDRVEVRIQDYREVGGEFDAVLSVEMIEAVGEEFWPAYFKAIDERLTPGGTAVVQAILMEHQRLLATRNSYGWIQKYIFPGGLIPSLPAIEATIRAHTALEISAVRRFGVHYAETLRRWRVRFLENWPAIERGRFDDTFKRMWEFYLAYCEAGFATGYLDVAQISFKRTTG